MKNILVTGGAGFIGSNFVRYLLNHEDDIQVINLDSLTYAGSLANLQELPNPDKHTFIHGDIGDSGMISGLFKQYAIDTVIHFAAESHVDRSILGPGQFIQTNIVGTFTLLEAARQSWLIEKNLPLETVKFHHVSTDEVFGSLNPTDPAFTENTAYSPRSPYSASKAASDHLVRAYSHTYNLPVTISNCTNNYGPFQFPEKLIPLMIINAITGKPLPVYGDGMQIRDWLYVEDHCQAILQILKNGRAGETYAIGGNNQPANIEIVTTICEILDNILPDSPYKPHISLIKHVTDRPGHDRRYAMDITKIQTELGWHPTQNLKSGLEKTIHWYLNHPEWVCAIQGQTDYQSWVQNNYTKREVKQ